MTEQIKREWLEKFFDEFDRDEPVEVLTSTGVVYQGMLYGYDENEHSVSLKLERSRGKFFTVHIFLDHIVAIIEKDTVIG